MIASLLFLVSLALFAWGQPHISPILSAVSSSIGLALMWLALFRIEKNKHRYVASSLWFFAVQLVQLSWLASPTYQGTYIYFVYGGLALWLGAEFGILSLFLPKKGPISFRRICGIAGLWTLIEWSRLFVLCGFAWNPIGLSLTGFSLSSQLASVIGIFGLSFIVMLVNLLAVNLFLKRSVKALSIYGAFLLFPYLFGAVHLEFHERQKKKEGRRYQVALVQTSLLPDEKEYYYGKEDRFVHPYLQWHLILTYLKKLEKDTLDLIVLPEYAFSYGSHTKVYPFEEMAPFMEELGELSSLLIEPLAEMREGKWYVSNAFWGQAVANYYHAELVMGLASSSGEDHFNAAFHFTPHSADNIERYEKRVLLPLAEYLPFTFLKPLVARYGITNFFSHGSEAKVMGVKHPMSLSVCYEECFPHIVREGRRKGAKLFVNVTNDGWYPRSRLPEQHFIHGRMRAIENGVPLLRACNTGITAGINSLGKTVERFEGVEGQVQKERGALFIPLNLYSFSTLYTFWGDNFIVLFSLGCLLFLRFPLAENRPRDLS